MIYQIVLAALSLPTITHNNMFGNDNQIHVNGVDAGEIASPVASPAASPPAASPPAASPPVASPPAQVCGIVAETVGLKTFPPSDMGDISWANPLQADMRGYKPQLLNDEVLREGVRDQRYLYPPRGISCLGFRGMVDILANHKGYPHNLTDRSAIVNTDSTGFPIYDLVNSNAAFGLPKPKSLILSEGETFMTYYLPWKVETESITDPRTKRIRKLFAKLIEGFVLLLSFEQYSGHTDAGTRWASDMLFINQGSSLTLPEGVDPDLFPVAIKLKERLFALNIEYYANNAGLSDWFSDDPGLRGQNYLNLQGNIDAHTYSAATSLKATGFSDAASAAFADFFKADYLDNVVGSDVSIFTAPTYATIQYQGKAYPDGFEICKMSREMYDYMNTIFDSSGKTFSCGGGADLLAAISELHKYEIVTQSGADATNCNRDPQEFADLQYVMYTAVSNSQIASYGYYGNPVLTSENTRVLLNYITNIMCLHLGYLNVEPSCQAANQFYYGRPAAMLHYTRMLNVFSNEDPLSVNGYISQEEPTIGRPGYASTNEICVIAQEFQDLCGTPNSDDCPYTPPDRNGFLDKCQDNGALWAAAYAGAAAQGDPLAQSLVDRPDESCGIVQAIVTDFDDTYFAGASIQPGCGFEMQNTGLAVFVNIDTTFADICPETCLVVPSTCSNATNATAAA